MRARFPTIRFVACAAYDALPAALADAEPEIVFRFSVRSETLPPRHPPGLPVTRWIANGFAGVDHLAPWDESRIVVTNVAGVAAEEMAQYVLAAILGLHQRFRFRPPSGGTQWDQKLVRSASGATVAIVGLGHTGGRSHVFVAPQA